MNHPYNNGTTTGTYTPPAMYTPRQGADAHKRYSSLITAGVTLAAPVPSIAPTPAAVPSPQAQRPSPVAHGAAGYLPKQGSVAHRLCMMFLQHPDLSYTAADVARWFATKKDLVPNLLANSIDAGLLARKRDSAEVFYSAGPAITRIESTLTDTKQKEPQVAITKQIPAKRAKLSADEDYSTSYKPKTVIAPVVTADGHAVASATLGGMPELKVVSDPLPTTRVEAYKYDAIFDSMAVGQSVRAATGDVPKVAAAMRNWSERRGIINDVHIKGAKTYCEDTGYGRVWLLPGKSLAPKRSKKTT